MGETGGNAVETSLFIARVTRELSETEQRFLSDALPPERKARLQRLKAASGRAETLRAYSLLRVALYWKRGWRVLPQIALSDNGKPYFPAFPDIFFNISHTDGAVMVGVSGAPIGVDIERARPTPPRLTRRLSFPSDAETFFRVWTAAEAIGKRDGRGVVPVLRGGPDTLSDAVSVDVWPGYFAACAVRPGYEPTETRFYTL